MSELPQDAATLETMIRQAWDRQEFLTNWELSFIADLYSKLRYPPGHRLRVLKRNRIFKLYQVHGDAMVRTQPPKRRGRPKW